LLTGDQRRGVIAHFRPYAVIHLAGEEAQRQTDHPGAMRQHALDGEMRLASIGRAENGRCGTTGGHGEIAVPLHMRAADAEDKTCGLYPTAGLGLALTM